MRGTYDIFRVLRKVKYLGMGLRTRSGNITAARHGNNTTTEAASRQSVGHHDASFPNLQGICPHTAVSEMRGMAGNTGAFLREQQEFH